MKAENSCGGEPSSENRVRKASSASAMRRTAGLFGCVMLLFGCVLLMAGCCSYRFNSSGDTLPVAKLNGQYRITGLSFDVKRGFQGLNYGDNPFAPPDPWSLPQAVSLMPEKTIVPAIKRKVKVVWDSPESVPVEIAVSMMSEHKELQATILIPYLVSLGTLPMWNRTISACEVSVAIGNGANRRQYAYEREFVSEWKMTATTPIGLMDFDRCPDAIAQRRGNGTDATPHLNKVCRDNLMAVFAETVAEALSESMTQYESAK